MPQAPLTPIDQPGLPRLRQPQESLMNHLRSKRPSLLDLRFNGDAWIQPQTEGGFALCLGNFCLAQIEGLSLDMPALNNLLDRARHRQPRWHAALKKTFLRSTS
jgi:hypothetical protein